MYPVFSWMDSLPQQRHQMPHIPHNYPSFESVPPQMKVDTSRPPVAYETWPYGGNYGHSIPPGCHGCCNHSFVPGYCGFRPPYPHYPPPSPFHCQGGYPFFPGTYPVQYVPPPHYSMEQPRYEYDKNVPGFHHCCGCPNHSCNLNEDKGIKIEEHKPDLDKRTNGEQKSSNSLVPIELKNHQYPVVWIPPGYMKSSGEQRESRDHKEAEMRQRDEYPRDRRSQENLEQGPNAWHPWFPFDINSLGGFEKHKEDGKKTQKQMNGEKNEFPFPIFWLPYKPEERERTDHPETNTGQKSAENLPTSTKDASLHVPSRDENMGQSIAREEKWGSEKTTEKRNVNQKTIPVKQLEEYDEKKRTGEVDGKARGISVNETEKIREKDSSENCTKRQSSSPPKASKLPPVCLRVDPLPKRKSGDCSSRSPSPPGNKGKSQKIFGDISKSTSPIGKEIAQDNMQSSSCTLNQSKEAEEGKRKVGEGEHCKVQSQPQPPVNLPSISQSTGKAGTGDDVRIVGEDSGKVENKVHETVVRNDATIKGQLGDGQSDIQEDKGVIMGEEECPVETKKAKTKSLSEVEGAVVIQSAFRGYQVRKWEPLKKLRQIARLREQVAEVRSRIEALESSPEISTDNKQRLLIGETIMSLLLKLDTIQGLHPNVRDIRKSVAKELVSLQERLDAISARKSAEVSTAKPMGDDCMINRENTSGQEENEETEVGLGTSIVESEHGNKSGSVEPPRRGEVSYLEESMSGSQAVETLERDLAEKEPCEKSEEKITEHQLGMGMDSCKQEAEALNGGSIGEPELPVELLPLVVEQNADQEVAIQGSQTNEQLGKQKCETVPGGEVESVSAVDAIVPDAEIADATHLPQVVPGFKEGPVVEKEEGEKLLAHMQGEIGLTSDDLKTSNFEYEDQNDETLDHAQLKIEEHALPTLEEEVRHLVDTCDASETQIENYDGESAELENPHSELPLEEDENHGGAEASETEVPRPELPLMESRVSGEEASEREEPGSDPLLVRYEFCSQEQVEDSRLSKYDEISAEEKEELVEKMEECKTELSLAIGEENEDKDVAVEETEGCRMVSSVTIGEENEEMVEDMQDPLEQESVGREEEPDKDKQVLEEESREREVESNIKKQEDKLPSRSETADEGALAILQIAPASAEQYESKEKAFPMSPTASQVSMESDLGSSESDRKLIEENQKLKEMIQKLLESGKDQLTAISDLSGRVKYLEKKLARKKKSKTRRVRIGPSCAKASKDSLKGSVQGIAV